MRTTPAHAERPERPRRSTQTTAERRQFTVTARRFAYDPQRLEVDQHDLVKVNLSTDDIAHSFTIEAYRISKRVRPGETATFEFLADRAGTFPFYCSLTLDEGCRRMRGELVVRPRP